MRLHVPIELSRRGDNCLGEIITLWGLRHIFMDTVPESARVIPRGSLRELGTTYNVQVKHIAAYCRFTNRHLTATKLSHEQQNRTHTIRECVIIFLAELGRRAWTNELMRCQCPQIYAWPHRLLICSPTHYHSTTTAPSYPCTWYIISIHTSFFLHPSGMMRCINFH